MARGEGRRLEGIPFTVKDLIATAGVRTTAGSIVLRDYVPSWSAPGVQRLQAEGAILLGNLTVPSSASAIWIPATGCSATRAIRGRSNDARRFEWRRQRGGSGGLTSFGIGTDYGGRCAGRRTALGAALRDPGRVPNYQRPGRTAASAGSGRGEFDPFSAGSRRSARLPGARMIWRCCGRDERPGCVRQSFPALRRRDAERVDVARAGVRLDRRLR